MLLFVIVLHSFGNIFAKLFPALPTVYKTTAEYLQRSKFDFKVLILFAEKCFHVFSFVILIGEAAVPMT